MELILQAFRVHGKPLFFAIGAVGGCALYFSLPWEMPWWGIGAMLTVVLALFLLRHSGEGRNPALQMVLPLLLGFTLFFTWGKVYTHILYAEPTPLPTQAVWMAGHITDMERRQNRRTRLTVADVQLYDDTLTELSAVHISTHTSRIEKTGLRIGTGVAAKVLLERPKPMGFAADFDRQFYMYFKGIEASGYIRGELYSTHGKTYRSLWPTFTRWRQQLTVEIEKLASPLAAALITGRKDGLPQEEVQNFRASGLAHLLAISGLHIGLVGGLIFFFLRYVLCWFPSLALTYPVKGGAAIAALTAVVGYMILAGATIPTLRAALMLGLVFAAVLLGRARLGVRLLAIAALVILLLWPYAVGTPSFQMSFIATLLLILWSMRQPDISPFQQKASAPFSYTKGVLYTGVLAGLGTLPFAAYHFGSVSLSGIVLNILAIPLMGFWVMPLGILAVFCLPFGVAAFPLWGMEQGLNVLRALAHWGANVPIGGISMNSTWLLLLLSGCIVGFFCCLWQGYKVRAAGTAAVFLSLLFLWPTAQVKKLVVLAEDGAAMLCHETNICQPLFHSTKQQIRALIWYTEQQNITFQPTVTTPHHCESAGCTYHMGEGDHPTILFVGETPTAEDCALADMIISPTPLPDTCHAYVMTQKETVELSWKNNTFHAKTFTPNLSRPWQQGKTLL